ncbi:MAG: lysophospholipid acyltransferase family protein [Spirochaetota bacterium]
MRDPERYAEMRRRRHARRARRKIGASRALHRFLRTLLAPWIIKAFRVKVENLALIRHLHPPYLIMPNHTSVWDPFIVNIFVPHVIHYVVSDANFRSKLVEFGLGLVGSIPKTKVMSDLDTVKNIMKIKNTGGVVGIFPEGQNTWDGHTLPIYYSTAKLAKVLRIPVVTVRIAGAFLSKPRWGRRLRRGQVRVRYDVALTPKELRSLSVEQIDARIAAALEHDEHEFNRRHQIRYVGRDRAEYAEIALFACPQCASFDTLRSDGNTLACTECGYAVHYDLYGRFRPRQGALRFETMREWNLWQVEELRRRLRSFVTHQDEGPLFVEEKVGVEIGYKAMPLEPYRTGRLELHPDRIELWDDGSERETFPITSIAGINVQNQERLEFYAHDSLFRVTIKSPRGCTYKWDLAVRYMQELAASSAVV